METASLTDQLLEATDGDMFVRSAVANARITHGPWTAEGAAIWGMRHQDQPSLAGVGDPAIAATLLDTVLDEVPGAERVSLPRGWLDHFPPSLAATGRSDWDWFWTDAAPAPRSGEDHVEWLGDRDTEAINVVSPAQTRTHQPGPPTAGPGAGPASELLTGRWPRCSPTPAAARPSGISPRWLRRRHIADRATARR